MISLAEFVADFAKGIELADKRGPIAVNARNESAFQSGLGPHSENETIKLVLSELSAFNGEEYQSYALGVPYPQMSRKKCDLCLGHAPNWTWTIEVKLLRLYGDNGKLNDNMLMHILSPYPEHRSALTDCQKLLDSGLQGRKAIVMYAYESTQFPTTPALHAFELLANDCVQLSPRVTASFLG